MTKNRRSLDLAVRCFLAIALAMAVSQSMLGQSGAGQPAASSRAAASPAAGQPLPVVPASEKPAGTSEAAKKQARADQTSTQPAPVTERSQAQPSAQAGPSAEAMQSFQAQMRDLQEQAEEFGARAMATQAALRSIKVQMADQGLDLRLDVREAESRMTYLLDKARQEIGRGDAFGAEADLKTAGYAAEFIERFLGRR
jgi:flagellar motor protein MotB